MSCFVTIFRHMDLLEGISFSSCICFGGSFVISPFLTSPPPQIKKAKKRKIYSCFPFCFQPEEVQPDIDFFFSPELQHVSFFLEAEARAKKWFVKRLLLRRKLIKASFGFKSEFARLSEEGKKKRSVIIIFPSNKLLKKQNILALSLPEERYLDT